MKENSQMIGISKAFAAFPDLEGTWRELHDLLICIWQEVLTDKDKISTWNPDLWGVIGDTFRGKKKSHSILRLWSLRARDIVLEIYLERIRHSWWSSQLFIVLTVVNDLVTCSHLTPWGALLTLNPGGLISSFEFSVCIRGHKET